VNTNALFQMLCAGTIAAIRGRRRELYKAILELGRGAHHEYFLIISDIKL